MRPCLFMWIPKTAGTSIMEACGEAAGKPIGHTLSCGPERWNCQDEFLCSVHRSLPDMVRRGLLPAEELERRVIFTFVRNPWDRLVSIYEYARTHVIMKVTMKRLGLDTFAAFVHHVVQEPINPVWNYRYEGLSIANPQGDWLCGVVCFIGRFEHLAEDWAGLCGQLDIPATVLPHSRKTDHKHYSTYYTDETRQLAGRFYAEDVDRFGYTFEKE